MPDWVFLINSCEGADECGHVGELLLALRMGYSVLAAGLFLSALLLATARARSRREIWWESRLAMCGLATGIATVAGFGMYYVML